MTAHLSLQSDWSSAGSPYTVQGLLARSSLSAAVFEGPEPRLRWANPAYCRYFESAGTAVASDLEPTDRIAAIPARFRQSLITAFETGEPIELKELEIRSGDPQGGRQTTFINLLLEPVPQESADPLIFCYGRDVTEQVTRQRFESLRQIPEQERLLVERQTQETRNLGRLLLSVERRERQRLANLLHDELQPLLVGIQLKVLAEQSTSQGPNSESPAGLEVTTLLQDAIGLTRSLSRRVSPLNPQVDLISALKSLAARYEADYGLQVKVTDILPWRLRCGRETEDFVYQAVRELLLNVVKHAHAQTVWVDVSLHDGKDLKVEVRDNGKGVDSTTWQKTVTDNVGLSRIRSTAELLRGHTSIVSRPDAGTSVTLILPLTAETPYPTTEIDELDEPLLCSSTRKDQLELPL